ncbi:excinuclease ABC subunit UvrC [Anoxynatronum buryatiense]|uniref:UvrABC system protein C n=1 Tax=Anoxynatronum buryatiense TaxID=489973 RepID=A0AA45WU63_9CLOT|nr:excinuclease ABC subunit UvrC [Anoxynatronum buryatiense]SMP45382.1 Excinuclease ABC subunit C [Anoxynatronum buryatiense]
MMKEMTLDEKLKNLPDQPGIYQMLDDRKEIIYVGKARSLKNRVRQYFHSESNHPPKVRAMMQRVRDINTIVTDTEVEALILECNLIKENRPRYNILLRDDKSYPYIKITRQESFPRVMKTRNLVKDGSLYFGPYTDAGAVNETLELIRRMYPLKSCSRKIDPKSGRIERPCLNYHIRKCLGPCKGGLHQQEYREMIQQIILLLEGKQTELQKALDRRMKDAAESLDFEQAAVLRDQLAALEKVTEKQKMDRGSGHDQDVIATASNDFETCVQVFTVQDGKIVRQHHHLMKTDQDESTGHILASFIKLFYDNAPIIPGEILLEKPVDDQQVIEDWLADKRHRKVSLLVPQRGEKKRLVELVKKNALLQLEQRENRQRQKEAAVTQVLGDLQQLAALEQPPLRIEAVDISHTAGVETVGVLVVFENAKPSKKHYRKYRMRQVTGPDDTGSIEELLTRRLYRGLQEAKEIAAGEQVYNPDKAGAMPDLFLIDGGAGQVSTAERVLQQMGLHIPVMGMVKDDKHRTRWLLSRGHKIDLKENPPLWRLVTSIQDETHRFAISFHQQRRSKQLIHSELTTIPGVGDKRRQLLMAHFKTMDGLKKATVEELARVPGISKGVAENITTYFQSQQQASKE